jgi:hypothetical protein
MTDYTSCAIKPTSSCLSRTFQVNEDGFNSNILSKLFSNGFIFSFNLMSYVTLVENAVTSLSA